MSSKMTAQDHIQGVGAVITNLLGLETVVRIFMAHSYKQILSLPDPVDQSAKETYLTNFRSLGSLIDEYNGLLADSEEQFRISRDVVDIRDSFAHGRLLSVGDVYPATLYKFGIARDGEVPIQFRYVLANDWLNEVKLRIHGEQIKVVNCHKARGYPGF